MAKSHVKFAEWIASLLCHGSLRGSYIPDPSAKRDLRELYSVGVILRQRVRVVSRWKIVGSQQAELCGQRRGWTIGLCYVGGLD